MGKRDAAAGHGDERTREGGDNSERRSESDLERRRGAGTAETERFKINKMSCENVFGSLQNLRVFFRPFIYTLPRPALAGSVFPRLYILRANFFQRPSASRLLSKWRKLSRALQKLTLERVYIGRIRFVILIAPLCVNVLLRRSIYTRLPYVCTFV